MNLLVPLEIGLISGLILGWAVLALSMGFRLLSFPDLTVEGSLPIGAAVFAILYKKGTPLALSILCAVFAGGLAGALTGFLHAKFKINKFLAGIIVIAIAYSLSLRIMGGSNIGLLQITSIFDFVKPLDNTLGGRFHFGTAGLLAILMILGTSLVLLGLSTRSGLRLRVAGSNPNYARSLGINVSASLIVGLAITNCLAAFSGVLLAMHQGFADVSMGQGVLIIALAAMTIGERIIPEKKLSYHVFVLFSAILGSIVYQVLVAYAVRAGLAPTDLKLATAIMVLVVVAFRISRNGELLEEVKI